MNTFRRFTVTLVGILATCVLSAGAASAKVAPTEPNLIPTTAPSVHAHPKSGATSDTAASIIARQRLAQRTYIEHLQRLAAEQAPAAGSPDEARRATVEQGATVKKQTISPRQASTPSSHSGNDLDVAVLAVTALAGLALGAAGSTASRRLRHRSGLAA